MGAGVVEADSGLEGHVVVETVVEQRVEHEVQLIAVAVLKDVAR